jgi:sugar lactone lactonase YvrE
VGSLGLTESGKLVVALRHTVGIFDPADESWRAIAEIETEKGNNTRLNDGKVGPDGAFWVGSMDDRAARPRQPIGALYRVTMEGSVTKIVDGLMVSNGLAFAPDGKAMFHSDSSGGWLDRWELDPATGKTGNRKRIATFDEAKGNPDGGATDAEGNYWSAGITAQCLNKIAPDGRLLESIPVPVAAPTMPCFGGKDLRTLYVTSLRTGRPEALLAKYPLTGTTIVGTAPVAGSPVSRFRDR